MIPSKTGSAILVPLAKGFYPEKKIIVLVLEENWHGKVAANLNKEEGHLKHSFESIVTEPPVSEPEPELEFYEPEPLPKPEPEILEPLKKKREPEPADDKENEEEPQEEPDEEIFAQELERGLQQR